MQSPSYLELYNYCQTLTPKVSRKHITRKTLQLTNTTVKAMKAGLDTTNCRGFFLSAKNTESRFVQMLGTNVIVLGRQMNYYWERFIFTKELMHLFNSEEEQTRSAEAFEKVVTEFAQPQLERSAALSAEVKAFYMALACLCPEKHRLEYKSQLEKGHMDAHSIALQLRIPEPCVPSLFVPHYLDTIRKIIGQ